MQWNNNIFMILAASLIVSSVAAVKSKSILRSAVFLALSLLLTAFVYLLLGAELLAGIQILLYTGGVITLIIFALLISEKLGDDKMENSHRRIIPAILASISFFMVLLYFTIKSPRIETLSETSALSGFGSSRILAEALFRDWVLPLEILSILLLASIIGALIIARREKNEGAEK